MKQTMSNRVFDLFIKFFLVIFSILCLFPFINILALSFSSNAAVLTGKVSIFPIGFNLDAYKTVFTNMAIVRSFVFTVYLTILYTAITITVTVCAAYPLSKSKLKGRKALLLIIVFTMYFSGGLIPSYLLVNNLELINTIWALILPGMLSAFLMLITKTYFTSAIPPSLEEAATIDGCSNLGILIRIILPLSKPVLAAIGLFYAVSRWNGFTDALFYINEPSKYPIQMVLRQISTLSQVDQMQMDIQAEIEKVLPETIKAAAIIFATAPILLVYPFLQKHFISGIMIGSVKG